MSKKPSATTDTTQTIVPPLDEKKLNPVLENDLALVAARAPDLAQIEQTYGTGARYERERVITETQFYMGQAAEAMLEAGKRLVLLKEHELQGDFHKILQERLGLTVRTAQKMMQASIKYLSPRLASKAQALLPLGKTKLFDLMVEDDETLEALADGGTVAGLSLDDIDRMTRLELSAALRNARKAQAEADEVQARLLAQKNQKIDSLASELDKRSRYQPNEERLEAQKRHQDALEALNDSLLALHAQVAKVANVVADIYATGDVTAIEGAEDTIRWAYQSFADISLRHGIRVDFKEVLHPKWLPKEMVPGASNDDDSNGGDAA